MTEQLDIELPPNEASQLAENEPPLDLDIAASGKESDVLGLYLRQIGRVPLLKAEEEVELAQRMEAGLYAGILLLLEQDWADQPQSLLVDLELLRKDGELAKTHMLEANLRLVVRLAKRYVGRGLDLTDLIQEGNMGMVRAVEKFDYTKGFKFSTYATWWIRQALQRALADQAQNIRKPVHMIEQINKVNRSERDLTVSLGRLPTDEEIALEVDLKPARVNELKEVGRNTVSLQTPVGENNAQLGDFIEDEDAADPVAQVMSLEKAELIRTAMQTLTEREQFVLEMRNGFKDGQPQTLETVSRQLGLTRARVHQIEGEALKKLRKSTWSDVLRDLRDDA